MMAGNPNWWSMNNGMHPQSSSSSSSSSSQFVYASPNPSNPNNQSDDNSNQQDFPARSWSQLLLGGLGGGEEERYGASLFQQQKKLENWEEQVFLNLNPTISNFTRPINPVVDVKQEDHQNHLAQFYDEYNQPNGHSFIPVSSPTSCVTTLSNNFLNFSGDKAVPEAAERKKHQQHNYQDHLSDQGNSTGNGGVPKKARVQQSSAQPALKVRKEKLGDRITALHQLVSPFGKTDTASVLSEAIGYIRFLQGQIEALSSPYMRNTSAGHHQHSVQERNCLFPEEPGQFLNEMGMEGRGACKQDSSQSLEVKDLRSRGLCLVPISCTQHVANDNGADYWAPAALGGGGF